MTWTVSSSGTQTATGGGTEDVLVATDTTNATYSGFIDINNLASASEVLDITMYTAVLNGGTLRVAWKGTVTGATTPKIVQTPFVPSDQNAKFTLTQTAGTARTFPWKLLRQ